MTHAQRRTALAAGLMMVLIGLVVLAVAVHRAPASAPDPRAEAAQATAARTSFEATIAPRRDVSQSLLAPATDAWWQVVTGLGSPLALGQAPLPSGATWIAYTTARTRSGNADDKLVLYPAIYIGFGTDAQARAYRQPAGCQCNRIDRANTVTLLHPLADPDLEPFSDLTGSGAQFHLTEGSWSINVTALTDQLTFHNPHRAAQRAFLTALGGNLETPMTWQATSATPTGPWVGQLVGAAPASVDVLAAARAISRTEKLACRGEDCISLDPGLTELVMFAFVQGPRYAWGNDTLAPEFKVSDTHRFPAGTAARGAIDMTGFEGKFTGLNFLTYGPVTRLLWTLGDDSTLTVKLVLG